MKTPIAAALLSISLALPAFAASSSLTDSTVSATPPAPSANVDAAKGARFQFRQQMHEKMTAFVAQDIAQKLNLDATKSAKLAEAMKSFQQRKASERKTAHEEMQKLQQLVDSNAPDAQVKQQLAVIESVRDQKVERDAFLADTAKFLSVQEQAKLALELPHAMRDAHKMKREFRSELKPGAATR